MPRSSLLLLSALTALELIARTEAATAILNTAQVCPRYPENDADGSLKLEPRTSNQTGPMPKNLNFTWFSSGIISSSKDRRYDPDNPAKCKPLSAANKIRLAKAMEDITSRMEGIKFQEITIKNEIDFKKAVAVGECDFNSNVGGVALTPKGDRKAIALSEPSPIYSLLHRDSFLDVKSRDLMTTTILLHELLHLLGIQHPIDQNTGKDVSSDDFVIAGGVLTAHYNLAEGDKKILEKCFEDTLDIVGEVFEVELGISKQDFFTDILNTYENLSLPLATAITSIIMGAALGILVSSDRFFKQHAQWRKLSGSSYEDLASQSTNLRYPTKYDIIESATALILPDIQNVISISERLTDFRVNKKMLYLNKALITTGIILVHNQLSAQTIDDYPIATTLANILFDDNAIADGKVRLRNINTVIEAFKYIKQKFQTSEDNNVEDHEHPQQIPPFDGSENTQDLEQQQETNPGIHELEKQVSPAESMSGGQTPSTEPTSVCREEGGGADNPNARRDSSVIPGVDKRFARQRSGSISSSSSGPEIIGRQTSEPDTDDGIRPRTKVSYPSGKKVDNRDGICTSVLI